MKDLNKRYYCKIFKELWKAIVCTSIENAINIANEIAPEHLELMVTNPMEYLESIKNAASIFLGEYTPEPVGDYFAGTNHVLQRWNCKIFIILLLMILLRNHHIFIIQKQL